MPESDPLKILLAHDQWATAQILDACGKLSDEQFHQRFDIGPGSLHATLSHVVGAMWTWTDTLVGREYRVRPDDDGRRRTPAEILALHDPACVELAAEATRRPLDEMVTRRLRTGAVVTLNRAAVLTHVTTHGMHHRAQCLNMLRQIGVKPMPPSSVTEWTWLGEGK